MAMVASPSAAAAATVPSPPPPPASSCPPPQFHVLAVDDSLLDRKLIEGLLRTSSCHVTAVDSVTKALEFLGMQQQQQQHVGGGTTTTTATAVPSCSYCHRQEINLIITDYCMPGMTGYDLLKTVKGSGSPLRDIPVVIMSSENVPARINRCMEEGADDFFLKPVKLSDVSKLRPHLLRGKPTLPNDQAEGTSRGQDLQGPLRLDDLGQDQLCADVVVADADLAAAADNSPRSSNKRKAPPAPPQQGLAVAGGSVHLHDHRTRTTTCAGYAMPLV